MLTPAFAARHRDDIGLFRQGALVVADPDASVPRVTRAIADLGDAEIDTLLGSAGLREQAEPTLDAMANGLRIAAAIIALTGGFVVIQSLARAAEDRREEQAQVRVLGGSRSLRLALVSLPLVLATTIGAAAGTALAVVAAPRISWGLAARADPGSPLRNEDLALAAAGGLMALCLLGVTVAVVSVRALRPAGATSETWRPSPVVARAARLGTGVPTTMGLRFALERGRGRQATPVLAAGVAAGMGALGIMAVVVFAGSLSHAVTTPGVYGWSWDGEVSGTTNGDDLASVDAVGRRLVANDALDAVAVLVDDLEVTAGGFPGHAKVLRDLRGHTSFVVVSGREPVGPSEVAVGGTLRERLEVDLGDTLEVSAGRPQPLTVVGVVALPVSVDGGSSSVGLAMRSEAAEAIGFGGRCADDDSCSRHLALTLGPDTGGRSLRSAVRSDLGPGMELVDPAPPSEVTRLRAIDGLPDVVAAALGLLAVIAVAAAAWVTVERRTAELAVLRVLGLRRRDLRRLVTVQVAVLSVIGASVGTLLGVTVGRWLWSAVAASAHLPRVVAFPAAAVVAVPVGLALVAQVAATGARRASGRVGVEALRGE